MLYELTKEVAAELQAKGCPYPVVYGPERTDAILSLSTSRIVFERDRQQGDGLELHTRARTEPRMVATRPISAIVTVYAQATVAGAMTHEHERIADQVIDKLIVALRKRAAARRTLWRTTSSRMLDAEQINARGLERWAGVVYELRFEIDRGVFDTDWVGVGREEVALDGITSTDQIFTDQAPDGATPEIGC